MFVLHREIILINSSVSKMERHFIREMYAFPPVGLLYLSSLLKIHGYKVELCDLLFEDFTPKKFMEHLHSLARSPAMVGITVYTENVQEALETASLAKKTFPETKVVLGGPHATFRYEEMLKNDCIDFVVRGEGESSTILLLESIFSPQCIPLESIPGIAYKIFEKDGSYRIHFTDQPSFIERLDILPLPDYPAWSKRSEYSEIFSFVSSRGCPGNCIFCASSALSGRKYRFHSAEWVFSMLYFFWHLYRFNRFVFLDDTFLANKLRAKNFCSYLRQYWPGERLPKWACKSRVDVIDQDIVHTIVEVGCISVHIGVESGNQNVLDHIGKKITLSQVYNSLRLLNKYGLKADCSFIIGHHCDTLESIEETILLAQAIEAVGMGSATIGVSTPFPGTRLLEEAEALGIQIKNLEWSKYDLATPIYETCEVKEPHLRKALFYFEHERKIKSTPNLSGRRLDEINSIKRHFMINLKGEDFENGLTVT